MTKKKEKVEGEYKYYEPVRAKLEEILRTGFPDVYLEITANKKISNRLKAKIGKEKNIIFFFLGAAAPDITGYVRREKYLLSDFLVVEVKAGKIKLDDVYQARKYAEMFNARYALLVSTEEIPEEIKRLSDVDPLLRLSTDGSVTLVRFDKCGKFTEWFPENPFIQEEYDERQAP